MKLRSVSHYSTDNLVALLDPHRIQQCPECAYSLLGLPDYHKCPECGTPCDSNGYCFVHSWKGTLLLWLCFIGFLSAFAFMNLGLSWGVILSGFLLLQVYNRWGHASGNTEYMIVDRNGVRWKLCSGEKFMAKWQQIACIVHDPNSILITLELRAGEDKITVPPLFLGKVEPKVVYALLVSYLNACADSEQEPI